MTGKLDPDIENPVPVTTAEFTVTGAVPLEVRVTVCVVLEFKLTAPNGMLVALTVRTGVGADPLGLNWMEKIFETPPALAVIVAICAVVTD